MQNSTGETHGTRPIHNTTGLHQTDHPSPQRAVSLQDRYTDDNVAMHWMVSETRCDIFFDGYMEAGEAREIIERLGRGR